MTCHHCDIPILSNSTQHLNTSFLFVFLNIHTFISLIDLLFECRDGLVQYHDEYDTYDRIIENHHHLFSL